MKVINGDWWPDRDRTCHVSSYNFKGADTALSFCRKTELVIQAGGNVGVWPRYLRSKFNRVITFEPSKENYELMLKNLSGVDVQIFNAALSDRAGRLGMKLNPQNCGDDQTIPGSEVVAMTVDDLDLSPDLLYLDIQGDELPALKGARQTLERCSPVVVVEIDGHQMRRHGDPRPFLQGLGYELKDRAHQDYIYVRSV